MYLLTNCHSNDTRFCIAIAKMYLLRWRIEEHFRFKKHPYSFEDFRVRSLSAIRTLQQLVTLLTGYMALLTQETNMVIACVLREAARAIPRSKNRRPKRLLHYELAAGFARLLRKTSANLYTHFPPLRFRPDCFQLSFISHKDSIRLAYA